jgi:hypothetical protein
LPTCNVVSNSPQADFFMAAPEGHFEWAALPLSMTGYNGCVDHRGVPPPPAREIRKGLPTYRRARRHRRRPGASRRRVVRQTAHLRRAPTGLNSLAVRNDENATPKVAEAPPTEIFAPTPDGLTAALPLLIRLQKRPRACSPAVLWHKLIPLLDPERIHEESGHRLQTASRVLCWAINDRNRPTAIA